MWKKNEKIFCLPINCNLYQMWLWFCEKMYHVIYQKSMFNVCLTYTMYYVQNMVIITVV